MQRRPNGASAFTAELGPAVLTPPGAIWHDNKVVCSRDACWHEPILQEVAYLVKNCTSDEEMQRRPNGASAFTAEHGPAVLTRPGAIWHDNTVVCSRDACWHETLLQEVHTL